MQAHSDKFVTYGQPVAERQAPTLPIYRLRVGEQSLAALRLNTHQTGVPIILLHDVTQSVYSWVIDQVLRHYGPTYSLSLPGHAPASATAPLTTEMVHPQRIATTLAVAMRRLIGKQPAIVVGHGGGGFAALAVAAHYPELVQGVITLSGFAQGQWSGTFGWYQQLARSGPTGQWSLKKLFQFGLHTPGGIRQHVRSAVANPRTADDYPYLDMLIAHLAPAARQIDLDTMVSYYAALYDADITSLLPTLRVPTLVVAGERDPLVPSSQSMLIARRIPKSTLAVLQNVGHFPMIENPTAYTRLLHAWMSTRMGLQPVYEPLPSYIRL